jgi:uncharacterized integral membrane protein
MKTFLKWLVLAPVGLILLAFAVANREPVRVVLDPLPGDPPSFEISAPLFLVLLAAGAFGIIAGSLVTWWAQGRHRRAARLARAEAERLRQDSAHLRGQLANRATALEVASSNTRNAA